MSYNYGQSLQLRKDVTLNFYVDGIFPAGQLGYTETYYKLKFDEADMIMAESLVKKLFELKTSATSFTAASLKKKTKDDLIALASAIDSTEDLTKLNKDDLIGIILGSG